MAGWSPQARCDMGRNCPISAHGIAGGSTYDARARSRDPALIVAMMLVRRRTDARCGKGGFTDSSVTRTRWPTVDPGRTRRRSLDLNERLGGHGWECGHLAKS